MDDIKIECGELGIYYTRNGIHHREDGPAIAWHNGATEWWLDGNCHREDGPAIEDSDGSTEWWNNGTIMDFDEWLKLTPISEEEKIMLKLKYG